MEQQKAIAILDLFATSRTGIDVASDQIIMGVRSGEVNPLTAKAWAKTVKEVAERVEKETAFEQLTEAGKYPEKTFEFAGATFTKTEHGTKYDYTSCGDPVWERLDVDARTADLKRKDRETYLRSLKEPMTVLDQMTGEIVTITPPVKTSTSGLNVSIK